MKFIIIVLLLVLSHICEAQAHLGVSLNDLKALYPQKTFSVKSDSDGPIYATVQMDYGLFYYLFDKTLATTYYCIQVPNDQMALNAQVGIYNKKYVILNDTTWKAYLPGGMVMSIDLSYNDDFKTYVFSYKTI